MRYKYKVFILGDVHIPYHDIKMVNETIRAIKKEKPDKIVINGDFMDFSQLSSYIKNPRFKTKLQHDLDIGKSILANIRKAAPNAEIIYVVGNHDGNRLLKFVSELEPLQELAAIELKNLLELDKLNIKLIDRENNNSYVRIGNTIIGHFNLAYKGSGNTVRSLLNKYGVNDVQSHTHRAGLVYQTLFDRTLVGVEAPALCKPKQPYIENEDWQFGYVVMEIEKDKVPKVKIELLRR